MSLYSLHPIELQLIAQFLPVREILSFARRCRFTLAALDSPFAFQCDPLKFETKNSLPGAFSPDRRLMRHVQVSLVWSCPSSPARSFSCLPSDVDDLLALALPAAGVVSLDVSDWLIVSSAVSERVLSSPCMRHLRELRGSDGWLLSPAALGTAAALSGLQRLQLSDVRWDSLGALERFPCLAELDLTCFPEQTVSQIPCLPPLISLRSLRLDYPLFNGRSWLPFWSAVSGVVSVSIGNWDYGPNQPAAESAIPNEDFVAAFRSLKRMRSFMLVNMSGVNRVFSHLSHAPALTHVHLLIYCENCGPLDQANCCPSPAAVRSLLVAVPALTISMTIETSDNRLSDRQRAEEWQSVYDDERAEFGQRLQIEATAMLC